MISKLLKKDKKGFTLMETLIVVAIIAILVAIAIPIFSNALTRAKVSADKANVRAYYAEVTAAYMLEEKAADDLPTDANNIAKGGTLTVAGTDVKMQAGAVAFTKTADKWTITYTPENTKYEALSLSMNIG